MKIDCPITAEVIGDLPDDTLDNIRDLLAVAAAVAAPHPWDRAKDGILRLLGIIDVALNFELERPHPTERQK